MGTMVLNDDETAISSGTLVVHGAEATSVRWAVAVDLDTRRSALYSPSFRRQVHGAVLIEAVVVQCAEQ